jgi:hypothetical protein
MNNLANFWPIKLLAAVGHARGAVCDRVRPLKSRGNIFFDRAVE